MITSCNVLNLELKFNLILDQQRSSSYREMKDNFQVSLGFLFNILKGKHEHLSDYESHRWNRYRSGFRTGRSTVRPVIRRSTGRLPFDRSDR